VVAVTDALAVGAGIFQLLLLGWIEDGDYSDRTVTISDSTYAAGGGVQVLAIIATIVLFLRWFHRAYKNLPALSGGTPRYGSGWAVGGWFVPILNVFRPKQVANDLWRGSDPDLAPDAVPDWSSGRLPALYAIWWGGWIISSVLDNASFRLSLRAEALPEIVTSTQVTLAADLLGVPLSLVAAAVVGRTTRRMEERAARVLSGGDGTSPTWGGPPASYGPPGGHAPPDPRGGPPGPHAPPPPHGPPGPHTGGPYAGPGQGPVPGDVAP